MLMSSGALSAHPLSSSASEEAGNTPPTGSFTITGTTTQGQTLTATDNLADDDGLGTFTYAWLRDDVVISGATSSTYLLTAFDVSTIIKARISYTDGGGTDESVTSTGTAAIAAVTQTTYQQCTQVTTIDAIYVEGVTQFTDFVFMVTEDFINAAFLDGGSSSAANGGGNIRAYKNLPIQDSNRIAIKINDFDINAGTVDIDILLPSLSAINDKTVYLVKVAAQDSQPAASATYGSDEVDNAITLPNNADLTNTLANMVAEADFSIDGGITCVTIGAPVLTRRNRRRRGVKSR